MRWQNSLRTHGSADWVIIVVETNDTKKKNKTNILPRSSIVDKIRSDFCNKQNDRLESSQHTVTLRVETVHPLYRMHSLYLLNVRHLCLICILSDSGVWFCQILWRTRLGLRNPGILCCWSSELSSLCPSQRTLAASRMTCVRSEKNVHSLAGASVNTLWCRYSEKALKKRDWKSLKYASTSYYMLDFYCFFEDNFIDDH